MILDGGDDKVHGLDFKISANFLPHFLLLVETGACPNAHAHAKG